MSDLPTDSTGAAKKPPRTPRKSGAPKTHKKKPAVQTDIRADTLADIRADAPADVPVNAQADAQTATLKLVAPKPSRPRRSTKPKIKASAPAAAPKNISPEISPERTENTPDTADTPDIVHGESFGEASGDALGADSGKTSGSASGSAPDNAPDLAPNISPDILPGPAQAEPLPELADEQSTKSSSAKSRRPAGSAETARAGGAQRKTKRKMFVSVLPGEQVEVVIAEDGQVQEYYIEMLHQVKVKGNIYKGIIHNVDPNLQAAFVSYGAVKNGFLQIDEVHPEYYLTPHDAGKSHKYPLIQKVLRTGQEVLVQVVKEPSGSKGAFLTSYLSLPGRFLVLTPGREQIGVSRKVDSEEERTRLRELLSGLNPGEGLGVIVRTVSMGTTKTNLQRDLQQLKRVWKEIRKKGSTEVSPCLIYQEMGLDTRAVRDYLTEEITELWVDDEEMFKEISHLVTLLFPKRENMVHLYTDLDRTLFEQFSLKKQLDQVHAREVTLPSGGRLVFDHTEALVAIDINSGRAAGKNNFEDTAYKTNLEAARQIPLQLRLRDIGGQVVIDFIEMRDRAHWRELEKVIRNGMKGDRARHDIGKISSFGLLEIVRQRLSSSAISVTSEPCPCCKGTGQRRNMEWQALQALREIRALLRKQNEIGATTAVYTNMAELVLYLLNSKKERLLEMEKTAGVKLELKPGIK
ncbi:MAG: Rne/Rng family ribonuclease [Deltaproteobacteria bacterium]|jgi:ribonuclease E|nr:Rne/Rng family ribonuclease [Deltaproteobacteria bacterium]